VPANDAIDARRSALVLVDYQARLMPAIHRGDEVVEQAVALADAARELGIRVIGTEQDPDKLGPNVEAVAGRCAFTVAKTRFDACEDGLVEALDDGGEPPAQVVIAGCEAHVCLLQTALGLLRRGRRVWVVETACGSRRPSDRLIAMRRLLHAGAVPVSTEMVLFEWLHDCRAPAFRPVLQVIKRLPVGAGTDPAGR
jgi:nicotinamidase-related amidase